MEDFMLWGQNKGTNTEFIPLFSDKEPKIVCNNINEEEKMKLGV
jgi:hypothetical protein